MTYLARSFLKLEHGFCRTTVRSETTHYPRNVCSRPQAIPRRETADRVSQIPSPLSSEKRPG